VTPDTSAWESIEIHAPELTIGAFAETPPERAAGAFAPAVEPQMVVPTVGAPATVTLSEAHTLTLIDELTRVAESLPMSGSRRVTWQQDGASYSAALILKRAQDGMNMDRVLAQISAENQGRTLVTTLKFKRLGFSSFAQGVDRWDPDVQMRDDEIDERVPINSRFNVMYDRDTRPKLLDMVTTAACGFGVQPIRAITWASSPTATCTWRPAVSRGRAISPFTRPSLRAAVSSSPASSIRGLRRCASTVA
jgi:hypothetical protein